MVRLLGLIVLLTGCATHADRAVQIRDAFHTGDTARATAQIDAAMKKPKGGTEVLKLDRAMVLLTEGKPKEAEVLLRQVRDAFDANEGKDAGEEVKAVLLDDQQRAYAGEDYEKVMVRVMLAICNLMTGGEDANAYALQVNEKQQKIIESSKLKETYKLVPVGAYLNAILREETHTAYDDAARSLELVAKWQPEFAVVQADLARVKSGHHSQPGHGVVYVIAFVGRGPMKEERAEIVSQASLLIADRLISAMGKQSLPPTLAPIKVPVVTQPSNAIGHVHVNVYGKWSGQTQTVTDVGKMAWEQCDAQLPDAVARAVVRRCVKKGIIYGAKELAQTDQTQLASLALNVAGVAWEATESADTRCWSLLPEKIQILRLELPAGVQDVMLQAVGQDGRTWLSGASVVKVNVANGRNTYVLANYPQDKLAGTITTSR